MTTEKYIKAAIEGKAKDLLLHQSEVFELAYKSRSGELKRALTQQTPTMSGNKLNLKYPLHIRFLDLARTRYGKRKKNYAPIYNKYTYGYLFSGIYARMRQKVSGAVKQVLDSIFSEDYDKKFNNDFLI